MYDRQLSVKLLSAGRFDSTRGYQTLEKTIDPYLSYIIEAIENQDRFTVVLVLDRNTVPDNALHYLDSNYQDYWKGLLGNHLDITCDKIARVQTADAWLHVKPTLDHVSDTV